jgi:hypothetical protein
VTDRQVSNGIETNARAEGISFAAAGDRLRVQMQTRPPSDAIVVAKRRLRT